MTTCPNASGTRPEEVINVRGKRYVDYCTFNVVVERREDAAAVQSNFLGVAVGFFQNPRALSQSP